MEVLPAHLRNKCTVSLLLNSQFPEFSAPNVRSKLQRSTGSDCTSLDNMGANARVIRDKGIFVMLVEGGVAEAE
jgi:hypothetical protein